MKRDYYDKKLERSTYSYKACGLCFVGIVLFLLFSLLFCGCSPKVVTVPEVHTEYIVKTDSFVQRDSVYVNDSVFIHENGDTVWVERFKTFYKDKWREVVKIDTVIKRDSIPYKVEVEKPFTWWQAKKIEFGELAMLIMAGLLCFVVIKHKIK